jgi:hypothetical protein
MWVLPFTSFEDSLVILLMSISISGVMVHRTGSVRNVSGRKKKLSAGLLLFLDSKKEHARTCQSKEFALQKS